MFDSLLIANRGEIACRIIRTARRMGLATIAVHSDADRDALHVRMADRAIAIGGAAASDSYLRLDRIMAAAKASGAGAIHPGYGFLSERPELARACEENGIAFVGPNARAIAAMGAKIEAKRLAEEAGVPCIPGYSGEDQSTDNLARAAREIGLPVMVKASAGGGGKGMRAVHDEAGLEAAIDAARTEAERAFGDGRLLIEKLVRNPRHVEVQLIGDRHGTLLHLFERDCSVQRNHQKLIEEAPAPGLLPETRERLFEAALRLGRAIGYDSAGTVEFVMDAATQEVHFLEMNTRLQVEHTVTEEITGLDLVELQLRAAAGEKLALTQDEVTCNGHAIQARLTAEDASAGFRPDTGKVLLWSPPAELRCDAGIEPGAEIGAAYDSMIAKLIAHGPDRDAARRKLLSGLDRLEVAGLATTRLFLRDALASPDFASGKVTTDFIARNWPDGWKAPKADGLALAAAALASRPRAAATPWQALSGFRLLAQAGCPARVTYVDAAAPESRVVLEAREPGNWRALGTDDEAQEIAAQWTGPDRVRITRDGVAESFAAAHHDGRMWLCGPGTEIACAVLPLGDLGQDRAAGDGASPERIAAPMPGLVVEIRVAAGDKVAKGDTLVVMESMKLLMELKAAADGTVAEIAASERDTVEAGRLLVRLEPAEG
ncbi:acetyl/propionyl/methylcrotonyl-CoA carboxylase subunit alpha [Stappia indica]|uniref:3-methylcrotonyl-CoA carboxylase alpha subunit n=1 Tax=Stappia indica TaxID=538381 RepID=A0A285TD35_9HYPH|nr:biotin carboxylase N-terminal domain-containing protein [Stappia indica]SOC20023.1 3-methylcrotonyl-CoA carboxylase alpha subunit [Stappia indica]